MLIAIEKPASGISAGCGSFESAQQPGKMGEHNQFISGLKNAGVDMDRKVLADIALQSRNWLAETAKSQMKAPAKATVGAVYDRAYFLHSTKAPGHRPRLQNTNNGLHNES
jgi:hypothetical protein